MFAQFQSARDVLISAVAALAFAAAAISAAVPVLPVA